MGLLLLLLLLGCVIFRVLSIDLGNMAEFGSELKQFSAQASQKVRCPYIPKHRVQPRNLPEHIKKCSKKLSERFLSRFMTCRYNSLHIFTIYEMGVHEMTCPNRQNILALEERLLEDRVLLQESSVERSSVDEASKGQGQGGMGVQFQGDRARDQGQDRGCGVWEGEAKIVLRKEEETDYDRFVRPDLNQWEKQSKPESNHRQQSTIPAQQAIRIKQQSSIGSEPSQPQPQPQSQANPKSPSPQPLELQLHECPQCRAILADESGRLWKNKKLIQYLKAYNKLDEELEKIITGRLVEVGGDCGERRMGKKIVRSEIVMDSSFILDCPSEKVQPEQPSQPEQRASILRMSPHKPQSKPNLKASPFLININI